MSIIGGNTLKSITLPGTHDSGTYYLTETPMPGDTSGLYEVIYEVAAELDKSVGELSVEWGQTQDETFYNQMKGGIRYFDLRSGWYNKANEWVTFHFVIGSPVQQLLQNISQYLHDYPTEIVVVEISHFDGYPSAANITTLKNMVLSILGTYLYPVDLSYSFTISAMVNSGKRAIVTMEQGYDNINIWPPGAIYNTYANTPDIQKMVAFNNQTVQQFMNGTWPGTLFKISWTLTANAETVTDTVIPFKPHSLIQLADSGNKVLPSFWISMKKNNWRMGNILIIDHFEASAIMDTIWSMNGIPY